MAQAGSRDRFRGGVAGAASLARAHSGRLHARPTRPLESPVRILHFAFLTDPARVEADFLALTRPASSAASPVPIRRPGSSAWNCRARRWSGSGTANSSPIAGIRLRRDRGALHALGRRLHAESADAAAAGSAAGRRRPAHGRGDADPAAIVPVFGPRMVAISEASDRRALIATDFAPVPSASCAFSSPIAPCRPWPRAAGRNGRWKSKASSFALMGLPEAKAWRLSSAASAGIAATARRHDPGDRRRPESRIARRIDQPLGGTEVGAASACSVRRHPRYETRCRRASRR